MTGLRRPDALRRAAAEPLGYLAARNKQTRRPEEVSR